MPQTNSRMPPGGLLRAALAAIGRVGRSRRGRRASSRRRAGVPAARAEVEMVPDENLQEDERPLGCGWFDSSHDLRSGLQVQEHASPDAVANELPLGTWLDWHLAGPLVRAGT